MIGCCKTLLHLDSAHSAMSYDDIIFTGKQEEVVAVHPRDLFIPQDSWTFLSAGRILCCCQARHVHKLHFLSTRGVSI